MGLAPLYPSFVANPLCTSFRPTYPLYHSVVEGLHVHSQLLQQSHVERVYPVPWSVLLLHCFLKYHSLSPPSHRTLLVADLSATLRLG